jgi:hypothetical protein
VVSKVLFGLALLTKVKGFILLSSTASFGRPPTMLTTVLKRRFLFFFRLFRASVMQASPHVDVDMAHERRPNAKPELR